TGEKLPAGIAEVVLHARLGRAAHHIVGLARFDGGRIDTEPHDGRRHDRSSGVAVAPVLSHRGHRVDRRRILTMTRIAPIVAGNQSPFSSGFPWKRPRPAGATSSKAS